MRSRPILSFIAIAYAWTWLTALPLLADRRGWMDLGVPDAWEAVAAFGPFIAALLIAPRDAGRAGHAILAGLLKWRVGAVGLLFSLFSPLALLGLALLAVRAGSGAWPDLANLTASELGTMTGVLDLVLVAALAQSLGEEPGWRGYLLPRLRQRFGPLAATLVLFPAWLFWHLPMFLSRPEFGPAQFLAFAAGILSAAIWLTFIWEATGSILMAVAWHAMINITRGIALAVSMPLFLAMSTAVLVGAVLIVLRWAVAGRRQLRTPAS